MLHLDYRDVAAKLFEQYREKIREFIQDDECTDAEEIYFQAYIRPLKDDCFLYNHVETFIYLDEEFHHKLKAEMIWYIEGEIDNV